ncbi:O-antigen ligase family protein [Thermoanaerobacterium thermosaccharolyticum]|uniref:O-antigen ligase family protein n=1 Tax=Thermoanaerobacterium thermosaccharolyticum TaxID=1517 RepID=UPI003DA986B2
MNKLANILYFLWVFLMLQADLKVTVNPYIDWFFTFVLFVPVIMFNIKKLKISFKKYYIILLPSNLLIISMLLSSFNSSIQIKNIFQSIKLILLFFIIFPILNLDDNYERISFDAFILSSIVNFGLIIVGKLFIKSVAWEAAYLRYGTIFNMPGSLYKPGIFILPYILYILLNKFSVNYLILLITACGLIFFDGSRSGFIGLIIAILYIIMIYLSENVKFHSINIKKLNYYIILNTIFIILLIVIINENLIPGLDRIDMFLNKIYNYGLISGTIHSDPVRYQMIQKAINHITSSPIIGDGFGVTNVNGIVIHNTYLQSWADMGILGFISLILLYFSWLLILPKVINKIRYIKDFRYRGLIYNSIFSLFLYDLLGLFHPMSVEPSEWITFFVPYTIFINYYWKEIYDKSSKSINIYDSSSI